MLNVISFECSFSYATITGWKTYFYTFHHNNEVDTADLTADECHDDDNHEA